MVRTSILVLALVAASLVWMEGDGAKASSPGGERGHSTVETQVKVYPPLGSRNPNTLVGTGKPWFNDMHASIHTTPDGKKHLYNWDFYVKGDYTIKGRNPVPLQQHATAYMTGYKNGDVVTLNIGRFTANVSGARIDPEPIKLDASGVSDPPSDGQLKATPEEGHYIRRVMAKLDIGK